MSCQVITRFRKDVPASTVIKKTGAFLRMTGRVGAWQFVADAAASVSLRCRLRSRLYVGRCLSLIDSFRSQGRNGEIRSEADELG